MAEWYARVLVVFWSDHECNLYIFFAGHRADGGFRLIWSEVADRL